MKEFTPLWSADEGTKLADNFEFIYATVNK